MKTKIQEILEHLQTHKKITSWEAIQLYRVTRISAVIFTLKESGFLIETETVKSKDNNGNAVNYAVYHYRGTRQNPVNAHKQEKLF